MDCKNEAKKLLSENGYSILSTKELIILLHDYLQKQIDIIQNNQEKQKDICSEQLQNYAGFIAENKEIIKNIHKNLPQKGFCENVSFALELNENGESQIKEKVNILWNDRKWIKGIAAGIIAIFVTTMGHLIVKFF